MLTLMALLTVILVAATMLTVWAIVDFALELAGKNVTARVILGVLVFVTGACFPYGIVEMIRVACVGDED